MSAGDIGFESAAPRPSCRGVSMRFLCLILIVTSRIPRHGQFTKIFQYCHFLNGAFYQVLSFFECLNVLWPWNFKHTRQLWLSDFAALKFDCFVYTSHLVWFYSPHFFVLLLWSIYLQDVWHIYYLLIVYPKWVFSCDTSAFLCTCLHFWVEFWIKN